LYKKFGELSESIQEALLAPETASFIYQVGKSAKLTDERISLLAELVGDVFMGSLKESDLTGSIKNALEISDAVAKNLTNEISGIIKSIKSGSRSLQKEEPFKPTFAKDGAFNVFQNESDKESSASVDAPAINSELKLPEIKLPPIPQSTTPNEEINVLKEVDKPQPSAPNPTPPPIVNQAPVQTIQGVPTFQSQHEAPFILHKEEEIEPAKEATKTQYNTQRPAFYKPTFSEEYKKSMLGAESARIELGEESTPREPKPGKTKNQETRIVHYSEFRTPLDPFSGTQEQQVKTSPAEVKKSREVPEVHPNNVVDLKDLPLE